MAKPYFSGKRHIGSEKIHDPKIYENCTAKTAACAKCRMVRISQMWAYIQAELINVSFET